MEVKVSKYAGFCSGVNNAINLIKEQKDTSHTYMLGHIIHNETVVADIKQKGVTVVHSLDEVPPKSTLIIRSHGATRRLYNEIEARGLKTVDASCTIVKHNQEIISKLDEEGYTPVMIGDKNHDEVKSIISFARSSIVIYTEEDIYAHRERLKGKVGILLQTTEVIDNISHLIGKIALHAREIKYINTICNPCKQKQNEIKKESPLHDAVLIVGSKTSKNTTNLFHLAREYNLNTFMILDKTAIPYDALKNCRTIFISAGTSTPRYIIDSAANALVFHK